MCLRGSFLTTNLLLRKISDRQLLETKLPMGEIFAQLCSIEESFKSFKTGHTLCLTSHVTGVEKTLKLKGRRDLKIKISANGCTLYNVHVLNASYGFKEIRVIIKVMV